MTSLDAVVGRVVSAPPRLGGVRLVAVDGPSCSGKSTFADSLVTVLETTGARVALVRTDDFATWDEPVRWWPRFAEGVVTPLRRGEPGGYFRTEWSNGRPHPGSWVPVPVPDVLVFEGVSAARQAVSEFLSLVVWVELSSATERLARGVARDGESARAELARWQIFEENWFAEDDTRARADVRMLG